MNIELIARQNIPMVWGGMEDNFRETIEQWGPELNLSALRADLEAGTNQLWLGITDHMVCAWLVTSILEYPHMRRLRFILMGGHGMEFWLRHIDVIEQWAAKKNCTSAEAWVRPGLRKKLARFGYGKAYEVVIKRIELKKEV